MTILRRNPDEPNGGDDGDDSAAAQSQPVAATTPRASLRRRSLDWALTACWIVNAVALVTAFGWVYADGRSISTIEHLRVKLSLGELGAPALGGRAFAACNWWIILLFGAAVGTLVLIFVGLFAGGRRFRSMRTWLAFTAVAAGWLAFLVSWPDVYWRGQQSRVRSELAAAESMADYLEGHWPKADGDLPAVGPFLAYPIGNPTTLMPLKTATFADSPLKFSAVERSAGGTIRFELAGAETGSWLEWQADGGRPAPFKSGLEAHYDVARAHELAPGWFLVRYRSTTSSMH